MAAKRIVLFGTNRYAISINDYFMFFDRSDHRIAHVFYPIGTHKNRDWWELGRRDDKARDSVVDPMDRYTGPITVWVDVARDVGPVLDRMDFDYICFGNGNDPAQKWLIERFGRSKCLFSEYGWLPWSEHFYIAREGAGFESDLARLGAADVARLNIDQAGLARMRAGLDRGEELPFERFVYMPLQKDVNDFKFLFSKYKDNDEFLRFVDGIAPDNVNILVKRHPLYKKKYDLSFSNRMVDITDADFNKHQIYSRMKAMICLNSTSILEALAYGAKVFSYGDDIFVGKDATHHRVEDRAEFARLLESDPNAAQAQRFVSLLLSRQISRARCVANDTGYISRHYWNLCL